jgi:hypothetical protein
MHRLSEPSRNSSQRRANIFSGGDDSVKCRERLGGLLKY